MSRMTISVFYEETRADENTCSAKKEVCVVVANIDQFRRTTSSFLESPAANGIAW